MLAAMRASSVATRMPTTASNNTSSSMIMDTSKALPRWRPCRTQDMQRRLRAPISAVMASDSSG